MANKSKPTPKIHELKPQPTVSKAIAAAKAHVNAVNTSSKK
jgi:hypothetical protein